MCCRRGAWCDSVEWRRLRSLSLFVNCQDVQCYNTSETGRHRSQRPQRSVGSRRLRTHVSAVRRRRRQLHLASVIRRRRREALVDKVAVGRIQTADIVGDVSAPPGDVIRPAAAVRLSRQSTQVCSPAGLHRATSRRRVSAWNVHRQSPQHAVEPASRDRGQRRRSRPASVERLTRRASPRRRRLATERVRRRRRQSSNFAARRSAGAATRHRRRTSAEQREATTSLLRRTGRTTARRLRQQRRRV